MRAAVFVGPQLPLEIQDVPTPAVPNDGVLIETHAAGVCRTDIHNWLGDWDWLGFESPVPRVLGHEMAGVVVAAGPLVKSIKPGDRVTVPFHVACGQCARCATSESNLCTNALYLGSSLPGAFAEHVAVPRADLNCVPLPADVSLEAGAALGCRFMTTWHGLNDLAAVQPGEWVLVLGAGGGVGVCAVTLASHMEAQVVGVETTPAKRAAAQRAGADVVLAADEDLVENVRRVTEGGADVTVDAVAKPSTVSTALRSLRAGGRHVQIGMTDASERGQIALPIDLIVASELKLFGVSGNPHAHYPSLLEFIRSTGCDPAAFIDARLRLDSINDGFARVRDYHAEGLVMITAFGSG